MELQQPLLAPVWHGEKDQLGISPHARSKARKEKGRKWSLIVPWTLSLVLAACWACFSDTPVQSVPWEQCESAEAPSLKAPKKNVWNNLSIKEANDIRRWLFHQDRGLNLTSFHSAAESDNILHVLEAHRPPKNVTLAYLAGQGIEPPRYAHAVVHNSTTNLIENLLIGPLPLSSETAISPLTNIYHNPDIPLNARSTFNWTLLDIQVSRMIRPIEPILVDLFNGSFANRTLVPAGVGPMSYDGEWRRTWVQLRRNVPGAWLVPVDFYIYVDMSGTDPSLFRTIRYVQNGTTYRSTEALQAAWQRGDLRPHHAYDTAWTTRRIPPKANKLDLDDRSGPRRVAFDGARFRVDREEGYVTWMGWAFYTSFERDMGLRFWDIKFRGDRIIYELSPQEAMAQYSGNNPHQASTVWLDRAFGMGSTVREVIIGYDCPYDATLLSAVVHEGGSSIRPNAICIFEQEKSTPVSRHLGGDIDESGAVKGYELVVRSISTVGNYDYIFDYTYQLDGTLEIRVSASGYLQGGSWDDEEDSYGHRLNKESMGSLHDHIINFKVDFDIVDAKNSMMAVSLETEKKKVDWLDEDEPWGQELVQQRIVREAVKSETKLNYPPNMQGAYVVHNPACKNAWGNNRGYSIHPGPLCHLTNLDSPRTEKQVGWAKSHLAVTRRKEEEPESSSMWNLNLPGRPPVEFDKANTPNTLTNLATSYVLLAPWNFNDYDPSIDSRNSILLNRRSRGRTTGEEPRSTTSSIGRVRSEAESAESGIETMSEVPSLPPAVYEWEETVVPRQCIPRPLERQHYQGMVQWDEVGQPVERGTFQELMPHRAKIYS